LLAHVRDNCIECTPRAYGSYMLHILHIFLFSQWWHLNMVIYNLRSFSIHMYFLRRTFKNDAPPIKLVTSFQSYSKFFLESRKPRRWKTTIFQPNLGGLLECIISEWNQIFPHSGIFWQLYIQRYSIHESPWSILWQHLAPYSQCEFEP